MLKTHKRHQNQLASLLVAFSNDNKPEHYEMIDYLSEHLFIQSQLDTRRLSDNRLFLDACRDPFRANNPQQQKRAIERLRKYME